MLILRYPGCYLRTTIYTSLSLSVQSDPACGAISYRPCTLLYVLTYTTLLIW